MIDMLTPMSEFCPGDAVRVVSLKQLERGYRHQLATLGIIQNKVIKIKQIAPLGDPICIEIEGALVALRKSECEGILVEAIT